MANSWEIRHDSPGRIRLAHPALHRRVATVKALERELMTVQDVASTGSAQVVFLDDGLDKLCTLRDIAAEPDRTVRASWTMIVALNIACITGIFIIGFGIIAAEITNNVAALAAVANGLLSSRARPRVHPPTATD